MRTSLLLVAVAVALSTAAWADTKTYQVTGPVVAVTNDAITVKKGTENWEIGKGADTKTSGDVKVGDKVTVMYRMSATSIESKAAGGKKSKK